jgi:hypothetical protein
MPNRHNSLAFPGFEKGHGLPSFSLWLALTHAVKKNVIVLAAAGNCVGEVVFPARYEDCIAVAGVNWRDKPWQGTCFGPDVTISALSETVYRAMGQAPRGNQRTVRGKDKVQALPSPSLLVSRPCGWLTGP